MYQPAYRPNRGLSPAGTVTVALEWALLNVRFGFLLVFNNYELL